VTELITVQPAARTRVAFARWAVAQEPKVRTVSAQAFGVPPRLFTDMPEDLLRGSLVDGRPYVSPLDHEEASEPAGPGAPELLGVATPDGLREAAPGQPLPEVPAEAYGPAGSLEFAPLEDAPATYEEGELHAVLIGEDGPETVVPLGDTSGDTAGDTPTRGEDTDGDNPAVTSGDTPEDTGDNDGDTGGDSDSSDSGRPYACGDCPRSFKSQRGRDSHRRQVHGEG
jgi:hypothetical protein